jgi:hypothetical protein
MNYRRLYRLWRVRFWIVTFSTDKNQRTLVSHEFSHCQPIEAKIIEAIL